jgi:hypothetical protein
LLHYFMVEAKRAEKKETESTEVVSS